ncbi:hypothetical protein [Aliiruegeria lutimaris]|uniref:Uncharacterized protein n=1 Tax=Aliiruegeria lutimaris TaxID=571298 RepID=A0A1G9PNM2_9RHOB|nr:hypothetical protein [Aliiruegeria lutimaris]SDM00406.1 hypothetical protein SAMN04488026_11457 [Aliiruegeria lutimaris]
MKLMIATIAGAAILTVSTAFAQGNSDAAKAMVESIKTNGANIAPSVSGKNASGKGDSGWGNAGSRLTTGTQVSKSGKKN